ncbi:MmcQ/YjbR family DNA-binding protein [Paenibacillus eucommiae]|uniref:DNA-binding protein (MmcQ/YjbR family) n=1 Tax=Paenibacillus eucommiae TaxID=1355755 RepID=A0ABS4J9K8_9BACL|nr:MmcQ/YjbR family DNA-binding protein [Paenibacillus eucommiae]MBP1995756.1 putative DNA-binding protein (MmcQ/YjbR family) [Paenibacillus eucommiae]
MDINTLTSYLLSKKGSSDQYPFGDDVLVIKVASKMFALLSERNNQPNISLKCDPFIAENLRQQHASITPGYHLNKSHWNTIILDGSVSEIELFRMIDHSYELVFNKLKKSEKDAIREQESTDSR